MRALSAWWLAFVAGCTSTPDADERMCMASAGRLCEQAMLDESRFLEAGLLLDAAECAEAAGQLSDVAFQLSAVIR